MNADPAKTCPSERELFRLANRLVVEEADEAALQTHVAACRRCAEKAASLAGAIARRPVPALPPDLLDRIQARIAPEEAVRVAQPAVRERAPRGTFGLLLAAAAAALLAVPVERWRPAPASVERWRPAPETPSELAPRDLLTSGIAPLGSER